MNLPDPLDSTPSENKPWPTVPIPPSVLQGPADADRYRQQVGKHGTRFYVDPLPADDVWEEDPEGNTYPAVSTVKKAVGQDWSHVAIKRIALEIIRNPSQFTGMVFDEVKDRLTGFNERGLSRASERGTNVHTYFELGLRGQPLKYVENDREPGANYLPAVREFFVQHRPELIAAEYVAIHRTLNGRGYGCTGDGIIEIDGPKPNPRAQAREDALKAEIQGLRELGDARAPEQSHRLAQARTELAAARKDPKRMRWVVAVDWKSRQDEGQHTIYPQEAAQIAAAVGADYMIIEGPDGPIRTEIPPVDCGIIVSIRPDSFRIYPVHIDKAWPYWVSLHAWWVARKSETDTYGRVWPAKAMSSLEQRIENAGSSEEIMELWRLHRASWTSDHTALAHAKFPPAVAS